MPRTGQQRDRRARLADAAAGVVPPFGCDRVGVVLHCPGGSDDAVLRLRRYAEVRDWTVTAEASSWSDAEELLKGTDAQGVVTDQAGNVFSVPEMRHIYFVVALE
ncbi:hypothetical protein [Streptomyces qinzhouensis]|uniref:Uncharacterized protein n=1 Tax=Streptomyces qinzhouensis TaxID=2599401 RepID=A0A5B8J0W8_9ACTN|nr:hypothetical protein [Streptomyces qinzhouensis]QDY75335.1 hypothetical protein FQU76_01155 [Streptomyces qinzhouensis]